MASSKVTATTDAWRGDVGKSSSVSKFEKLNRIGEGTYGTVYRARDKENGSIVALKKIIFHDAKEGVSAFPEFQMIITYRR